MDPLTNAPKLLFDKGMTPETYSISLNSVSIGRGVSNDLQIVADGVSRAHARIVRKGDEYYLSDLGSTSGTFLNDRNVEVAAKLRHGDTIELGKSVAMKFEFPGSRFRQTDISELVDISTKLSPAIQSEIGPLEESAEPLLSGPERASGSTSVRKLSRPTTDASSVRVRLPGTVNKARYSAYVCPWKDKPTRSRLFVISPAKRLTAWKTAPFLLMIS